MYFFGRKVDGDKVEQPPQQLVPALSAYKDNYFDLLRKSWGPNTPTPWVFKLGLKAPLWVSKKGNGAFLTYRMTGYWDIKAPSAPFRDINHNPGLVWLQNWEMGQSMVPWLKGYEAGMEHISNGQDNTSTGPNGTGTMRSRAIDYAFFVEPKFSWQGPFWGDWRYQPRIWVPVGTDENPLIRQEWGLLWNTLSMGEHLELSTKGNPFDKGSASAKLYLDVGKLVGKGRSVARASLTVFNGYGDGLLEYDKRRTWLRLGVSFSGYAD